MEQEKKNNSNLPCKMITKWGTKIHIGLCFVAASLGFLNLGCCQIGAYLLPNKLGLKGWL